MIPAYFLLLFLLLNVPFCQSFSVSSVLFGSEDENVDPDRPMMCYRGIKYFIGQEEIDDNVKCERNLIEKAGGMHKYCYKFTSNSAGVDFIKHGCSVMICTPLGEGCTRMEFEGVQGEMCCCSDTSYCNGTAPTFVNGIHGRVILLLAFCILTIFHLSLVNLF